jgi:Bacterial membrane protein YfhO
VMNPPLRRLDDRGAVRIYENRQALPRSFYVPRVVVVRDRGALLHRLGTGTDDLRRTSLIESPPSSGFTGDSNVGDGTVEFVRDEPERVTLRTHAPEHGFVFLADEYFPGWHATVDGEPTPILRANHAFRLVEVPAGDSLVEFRYAPLSLRLGALISCLTLLISVGALFVTSNRPLRRRA